MIDKWLAHFISEAYRLAVSHNPRQTTFPAMRGRLPDAAWALHFWSKDEHTEADLRDIRGF